MLEKITKYAGIIPLAAIAIYIFGYITLTSYLQSYGISGTVGLDFNILKLGILLAIIVGPIILLSYSDFKLGDYSNAVPEVSDQLINTLHDALGYTVFYSIALGYLLVKINLDLPTYMMIGFLLVGLVLNKIRIKPIYTKWLKGAWLIMPFFILGILLVASSNRGESYIYFLQIAVFTTCACLRIFNKEGVTYQISKIGTIITTVICSSTLLGAFLLDKIPTAYGGEKRTSHTYYIDCNQLDKVIDTSLRAHIKNNNEITIEEIYATDEMYYFKTSSTKVVAIPKTYITAQEINIPSGYGK